MSVTITRCLQSNLAPGIAFLLGAVGVPVTMVAQTVQGRLLDAATDQPVRSVTIQLLRSDAKNQVAAEGVTDGQGYFQLRAPSVGTYRLRSLRVGYQPVTTRPFDLVPGDDPFEVEVRISVAAVVLEPVTIVSERPARHASLRLANAGYYERLERYGPEGFGLGQFLEREEIRRKSPSQVSDVLRDMRGVWVKGAGGRRQTITLRGGCVPQVYVDGAPAATGENIDELISPSSLAAIEVYTGLSVPGEFWRYARDGMRQLPACGAIVLWTGYGGEANRRSEPEPAAARPLAPNLALRVALSTDSVTLGDTVVAAVTIANLADHARSLCVTESRYALRGASTSRDIAEQGARNECLHVLDLPPRGWISWREVVPFTEEHAPGFMLIQRIIRLRAMACVNGEQCEMEVRSAPHQLTLLRDRGGP